MDVKRKRVIAKNELRPSANDDGVSISRCLLDNLLDNLNVCPVR
jgi:hypothetical protein